MLCRPSPLLKNNTSNTNYSGYSKLLPGTFLHEILYGKKGDDTQIEQSKPFYVQNHKDYLKDLEKNYKYYGVPFKKPNVDEIPDYDSNIKPFETHVDFLDHVPVKLNVLKNGKVKVKLLYQMANLNDKYYYNAKPPPIKIILSTLKSLGYSTDFINTVSEKNKKRQKLIQLKWKKLEKYFDAPSVSSRSRKKGAKKKEKEKEKEKENDEEETFVEEEEENDEPEEDEGMDIEQDEEEDVVEDEYISDGGDN